MPTLAESDFNIVLSVIGGWVSVFGLVSYLIKEKFYLSEALISMLAGVAFSPYAANFIRPLDYTGSQANLNTAILYFSRLVLGVQLVLAGIQLPSKYLKRQWRPLSLLLGPIMTAMWLSTSLLVWGLVTPRLPFLHALVIGSCVTPTDPILSNVIVKGRFADKNVPTELQRIIIAESGANDGLGYPFLFLALYLIQYTGYPSTPEFPVPSGGAAKAIGLWFGETWGYTILLSVVYGVVVGYIAKQLLYWAEKNKFVDRESFLVFALSLALFIVGTCGIIGSDDILACFIAGNVFTWDDWFRRETEDDSLQPTIDMMLNVAIFMWYGAVCPWPSFLHGPVPLYRLVPLGILLLLLRRLPWIMAIHKYIPQIEEWRHGLFVGFFGPVGVSAIFYLYVTLDFLERMSPSSLDDGTAAPNTLRPDVAYLGETVTTVVWFLAVVSIVVHGLSVPLGKLFFYLPRTMSRARPTSSSTSLADETNCRSRSRGRNGGAGTSTGSHILPSFIVGSRVGTPTAGRTDGGASPADNDVLEMGIYPRGQGGQNGRDGSATGDVLDKIDSNINQLELPVASLSLHPDHHDPRAIYRIGGTVIPKDKGSSNGVGREAAEDSLRHSTENVAEGRDLPGQLPAGGQTDASTLVPSVTASVSPSPQLTPGRISPVPPSRTIRFPDDPEPA